MNEKIDEPSSTARARVHSTCRVMAVAPETAKAISAARRERASITGAGGSAAAFQMRLGARRVEPLVDARCSPPPAGQEAARQQDRRRQGEVEGGGGDVRPAQRRCVGRKTKPAKKEPATAPNRLTE